MTGKVPEPQAQRSSAEPAWDIGEELRAACIELMANYGVSARAESDSRAPLADAAGFAARAEFQGDQLKGSVTLCATRPIVEQTSRSVLGADEDLEPLTDWACELVNQLLGRFKNKLRPFDVVVDTGMPSLLPADDARSVEGSARYRFSSDHGNFAGYLDLSLSPGFELRRKIENERFAWEGEVLFL